MTARTLMMTPDSKLPADRNPGPNDPNDPRPPMQVYPPPDGGGDPQVTGTHVRLLREDILAELNQDDAQFILPLRTRLALLALLTASLCIVILLMPRRGDREREIVQAPVQAPSAP